MGRIKKFFCYLLSLILICILLLPVSSMADSGTVKAVAHTSLFSGEIIEFSVDFDDSCFEGNPEEYDHTLARMSLGMAVSSYRNVLVEQQDEWIVQYLSDAGFTDLVSEGYMYPTGEHTVSSLIASKHIGDKTVIAAVPCGGGYSNEWLSNFNVGTEERHAGFNEAAHMVEERILNYLKEHNISENAVLWMAGYSRGAAIANLVEADMTDKGIFDKVFGYNYAVPHNTKEIKEYNNIYNIVGKYDPVPMIPLGEWGYTRYGRDLFTPAQEMNNDYLDHREALNEISNGLIGKRFSNNPGVNSQLHMILEYLLQIMPTDRDYDLSLKESIKKAWVGRNIENILLVLEEAIRNMQSLGASELASASNLVTYIETLLSTYLRGNTSDVENGYWNSDASMAANIIHEHSPEVYIEWMYSNDDPEKLFGGGSKTRRLVITGDVYLDIYDENGYVQTVDENGFSFVEREKAGDKYSSPSIYSLRQGSQTILSLPGNKNYTVSIRSLKKQSAGYMITEYQTDHIIGKTLPIVGFDAGKNKVYLLAIGNDDSVKLASENGRKVSTWEIEGGYSPSVINQIESVNVFHITITGTIIVIAAVIAFVVLMIIIVIVLAIVHGIRCRKRGRPYSKYCVIVPHILFVLLFFLLTEVTGYIMPAVRIISPVFACLGTAVMLLIAVRGTMRRACKRNTLIIVLLSICTAGIFFLIFYTRAGVVNWIQFSFMALYFIAGTTAAVYTFPHEGKIKLK